jgi:hypothetical protein
LLLKKASGQVPHGGGKKLPEDGNAYAQVLEWIKAGQPRGTNDEIKVVNIEIIPSEVKMLPRTKVQTRVLARYSDGTSKDVTHLAAFQSSESVLASIDAEGLIQSGPLPGEAAIMARFMEKFSVCLVTLPLPETLNVNLPTRIDSQHYIDRLLSDKFVKLGLSPSALAAAALVAFWAAADSPVVPSCIPEVPNEGPTLNPGVPGPMLYGFRVTPGAYPPKTGD